MNELKGLPAEKEPDTQNGKSSQKRPNQTDRPKRPNQTDRPLKDYRD